MSTHVLVSAVFPSPPERLWALLRDFTFPARLLPSAVASATMRDGASPFELGAVREIKDRKGGTRLERLIELSDQFHRTTWETIQSDPPSETTASIHALKLQRISETNETLVSWTVDFSADVRADAIKATQQALQLQLQEIRRTVQGNKCVLILGAGLVARPIVHYLAEKGYHLVVASRTLDRVHKLVGSLQQVECLALDIESAAGEALLDPLTQRVDAVISMLPYLFHAKAARLAIKHGKHFLTTSYVSPAMRELEAEAKSKGLVIINECGVDPGTDHMSAMRVIHDAQRQGGRLVGFTSYCGGLPAPDANNNPLGYKLSWAPRGVLLASRNDAHFLRDGRDVTIPGKDLFDSFEVHHIEGLGNFEAYPNRNSTQYIELYEVPHTRTMIRGTYRNVGWCPTIKKLVDLGLLDVTERAGTVAGLTYAALLRLALGLPAAAAAPPGAAGTGDVDVELRAAVAKRLGLEANAAPVQNMQWLGLFSTQTRVGPKVTTYLDAVCQLFVERLQYAPGERDMLVMRHTFTLEFADRVETRTSSLIDFGIAHGDTSMARTVSYPVAIATRLVLEGKFTKPGLSIPTIPELYVPILRELEALGITFVEKLVKVEPRKQ